MNEQEIEIINKSIQAYEKMIKYLKWLIGKKITTE